MNYKYLKHSSISLLVLTMGAISISANAESNRKHHGPPIDKIIERFDLDNNGTITQVEIDQVHQNNFSQFDTNQNGSLELEEFESFHAAMTRDRTVDRFQHLDRDGDSAVTREEFGVPTERMMRHMDADGNGELSREELASRPKHKRKDHKSPESG